MKESLTNNAIGSYLTFPSVIPITKKISFSDDVHLANKELDFIHIIMTKILHFHCSVSKKLKKKKKILILLM